MNLNGKILAAAAITLGVFLGIIFFIAIPLVTNIGNIRAQTATMREEEKKDADRILRVRQYREFIKQEGSNLNKLDGLLVDRQMPLDFIGYLEAAAADSGIKVDFSPSVSQAAKPGEWPVLNFQVNVSGDIDGILRFTKKIETSPYLVTIQGFNVMTGSEKRTDYQQKIAVAEDDNAATAHILLQVYAKE